MTAPRRAAAFATVVFAAWLANAAPALAWARDDANDPDCAAETAFNAGDYANAVRLGRAIDSAESRTMAAWAELVEGEFLAPPNERMAKFQAAEADARRAIELAPADPDGHIARAVALGFIGRREGGLAAHVAGRAAAARREIDVALALAPGNPWAHALLGGWNLEIVSDGGAVAAWIYGATVEQGIAAYARARALDPANGQIAYQYALELLALGDDARRSEAARLLDGIAARPPADALGVLIRDRAAAIAAALAARDETALSDLLRNELGNRR